MRAAFSGPTNAAKNAPRAAFPHGLGQFLRYASAQSNEEFAQAKEGVLIKLETGQKPLRFACNKPPEVIKGSDIAYCPTTLNGILPEITKLSSGLPIKSVFPDTNTDATSGLKHHATLDMARFGNCNRAFISIGGGIADDAYRGEGLLYDLKNQREIARDKGDPGADYETYNGGKNLPVFCTATDLANYVEELLRVSIVK